MVVITDGNHPHFLVSPHQSPYKCVFISVHVLCLVNYQYSFPDFRRLDLAVLHHFGSPLNHLVGLFQISRLTNQVETKGVEGLDVHKMSCAANEFD